MRISSSVSFLIERMCGSQKRAKNENGDEVQNFRFLLVFVFEISMCGHHNKSYQALGHTEPNLQLTSTTKIMI